MQLQEQWHEAAAGLAGQPGTPHEVFDAWSDGVSGLFAAEVHIVGQSGQPGHDHHAGRLSVSRARIKFTLQGVGQGSSATALRIQLKDLVDCRSCQAQGAAGAAVLPQLDSAGGQALVELLYLPDGTRDARLSRPVMFRLAGHQPAAALVALLEPFCSAPLHAIREELLDGEWDIGLSKPFRFRGGDQIPERYATAAQRIHADGELR